MLNIVVSPLVEIIGCGTGAAISLGGMIPDRLGEREQE
jgi:hypothetical protein